MDDLARDVVHQTVPWKEQQTWWVVGIEGVVALLVGILVVADPVRASDWLRQLTALVLLVVGAGEIGVGFRARGQRIAPWAALRGGVGVTVALLTLFSGWSDFIAPAGARQMLAVGLLAYGAIGIVSLIFTFRATGFKIAELIADVLTIVLGLLLLGADADDTSGAQLLGAAAIIGGVALLIYAFSLWNRTRAAA